MPNPGLSWDAMLYTPHIPLPAATAQKNRGRHGEKMHDPEKQMGLHSGVCMLDKVLCSLL